MYVDRKQWYFIGAVLDIYLTKGNIISVSWETVAPW